MTNCGKGTEVSIVEQQTNMHGKFQEVHHRTYIISKMNFLSKEMIKYPLVGEHTQKDSAGRKVT